MTLIVACGDRITVNPKDTMHGPYSITITEGASARTYVEHHKRAAIAKCKRLTRGSSLGTTGDVKDAGGSLVKQVEAVKGRSGTIVVKDLEL